MHLLMVNADFNPVIIGFMNPEFRPTYEPLFAKLRRCWYGDNVGIEQGAIRPRPGQPGTKCSKLTGGTAQADSGATGATKPGNQIDK